ncbi:DUF1877 family protein [Nocardia sp. IBHARD005]|uniref:DUF1877 family protein n=1 Tax=Nocardia sp. IBHARD005 TaxID=3457765 RepID=UPI00405988BE
MGPVLAFHRISDADAARITEDAEAAFELLEGLDRAGEPSGGIDKAWDALRFLLEAAGVRLELFGDLDPWAGDGEPRIWTTEFPSSRPIRVDRTAIPRPGRTRGDVRRIGSRGRCRPTCDKKSARDLVRAH